MPPFWPFQVHRHTQHDYDKAIFNRSSSSVSAGYPPLTEGQSSSSSPISGNKGKKKTVSFAKLHHFKQLFKHIHVSELTKQEISDAWYSAQELDTIRDEHQFSPIIIQQIGNNKKEKKVSFAPQVKQYDYIHVLDFSDEEISNAWYTSSDLRDIRDENLETIQWMLNGCTVAMENGQDKQEELCSRGMEYKTPIGHRMRAFRRKESLRVLKDQFEVCSEKLAESYGRCTKQSAHIAWLAAKVDREHAIKYMAGDVTATSSTTDTTVTPPMSPAAAA